MKTLKKSVELHDSWKTMKVAKVMNEINYY